MLHAGVGFPPQAPEREVLNRRALSVEAELGWQAEPGQEHGVDKRGDFGDGITVGGHHPDAPRAIHGAGCVAPVHGERRLAVGARRYDAEPPRQVSGSDVKNPATACWPAKRSGSGGIVSRGPAHGHALR